MENVFREIQGLITEKKFEALQKLSIQKPVKFNWVKEVFEGIHVKDRPDEPALIWANEHETQRFSFKQMQQACNQFLNFLRKRNVEQQDVIFLQLPLLPANWISYLTAIKGGLRLIPSATILGVYDLVYRFERLMPSVVITDAENAEKIEEAERLLGKTVRLKIITGSARNGWLPFDDIFKESEKAEAADTNADDPLFLFFTSGTTGMPKVVIHTQLSYPLGHLTTASWIGLHPGDIHYNISQPGWAKFAWSSFFAAWNMGATVFAFYQPGRFSSRQHLAMMEKYKVTTFCAPPTVLRMLILEDLSSYTFCIRECVAAGEPLNPEVIEEWKNGTGLTIRDGYGQTESSCLVGNLPGSHIKFGSMGKPTFLYDVVIADEEGNELPNTEEGSITVKTGTGKPNGIFINYFDDAEKMHDVFKHGLYYTGDKAYRDEDGYIWFVGRDDDVIKTSDYRVGPFEVESILIEHESVIESAVVGSPHPIKGSEVKAFIILKPGCIPDSDQAHRLFTYCRKKLAPYKLPRIIEFVNELPKTISGKIRRVELRAQQAQKKALQQTGEHEYFYQSNR